MKCLCNGVRRLNNCVAKRMLLSIFFALLMLLDASAQDGVVQRQDVPPEIMSLLDSIEREYDRQMRLQELARPKRPLALFSRWRAQGQWGNDAAASLLMKDDYGTACDNSSNGFWRGGFLRDLHADDARDWGIGVTLDWMQCFRYPLRRQINQMALEVRWLNAVATLGMKQQDDELSCDRLPLMQLRIASDGWQELLFGGGLLHVKGFAAYGLTTGFSWNSIYHNLPHEGFHNKQSMSGAAALRIGKKAVHLDNELTVGISARDDWRHSWRWRTSLAASIGRVGAKAYNEMLGGEQTPLWSPRYRLGSDRQGLVLSYADVSLDVSQHRFGSWYTRLEYCRPEVLTLALSHMYAPERFSFEESRYHDSDIRHALLLKAEYQIPLRYIPGIFLSVAFGTDFCRKPAPTPSESPLLDPVNRRTVQVLLTWRRDLGATLKKVVR